MITIYENAAGEQPKVLENVNDIRQLLNGNQFVMLQEFDAIRATQVLGTANASYENIYWRRNNNATLYSDTIVTIG